MLINMFLSFVMYKEYVFFLRSGCRDERARVANATHWQLKGEGRLEGCIEEPLGLQTKSSKEIPTTNYTIY